jgi:hypothetical protein
MRLSRLTGSRDAVDDGGNCGLVLQAEALNQQRLEIAEGDAAIGGAPGGKGDQHGIGPARRSCRRFSLALDCRQSRFNDRNSGGVGGGERFPRVAPAALAAAELPCERPASAASALCPGSGRPLPIGTGPRSQAPHRQ